MRLSLIVPAAGLGSRFLQSIENGRCLTAQSKLLNLLGGEPVLVRTLKAFDGIAGIREIIVAISPDMRPEIKSFAPFLKPRKIKWVTGAATRAGSVWNALQKTSPKSEWILIHDGARPLISKDSVRRLFAAAKGWEGVILARKVVPTIKRVLGSDGHIESTVDRSVLFEAETPQMVRRDILFKAYKNNPRAMDATDEAGLLEAIGARVRVVPHDGWNPKITTVTDLMLAEVMMKALSPRFFPPFRARGKGEGEESPSLRFGIGFDTHRLVEGRKLWLGGVTVPSPKGSLGHSDGDVLLHAGADAVLGAIGGGDIGEWFSDKDRRWMNMRSSVIVKTVLGEAKRLGWVPYHVDSNIILQTPKLGAHKQRIRKNLAKLFEMPEKDVSVKARTREGLGPEGEGLCVTCEAIVAMRKI